MKIEIDGKSLEIDTDAHVIDWDAIDWSEPTAPVKAMMGAPKIRRHGLEIRGFNTGTSRVIVLKNCSGKPKEIHTPFQMMDGSDRFKIWPGKLALINSFMV